MNTLLLDNLDGGRESVARVTIQRSYDIQYSVDNPADCQYRQKYEANENVDKQAGYEEVNSPGDAGVQASAGIIRHVCVCVILPYQPEYQGGNDRRYGNKGRHYISKAQEYNFRVGVHAEILTRGAEIVNAVVRKKIDRRGDTC